MYEKFEYKVMDIPSSIALGAKGNEKVASEFESQLNKLGAEGWEFVQCEDGLREIEE